MAKNRRAAITIPYGTPLREATWMMMSHALLCSGGSVTGAARALGVTRRTIYNHMIARGVHPGGTSEVIQAAEE